MNQSKEGTKQSKEMEKFKKQKISNFSDNTAVLGDYPDLIDFVEANFTPNSQCISKGELKCCPVCRGRGNVSHGFYNLYPVGDTSAALEKCKSCNGTGYINETVTPEEERNFYKEVRKTNLPSKPTKEE